MIAKVFAISLLLIAAVAGQQQSSCEKKRMDYFRCEKKIESDDSLPTICDKIDAVLSRCFEVYKDCTDKETLDVSKDEYIQELVDTPIDEPVWQALKKCKLITDRIVTPKCQDAETVLMNKYHHKQCVEAEKDSIFKPLMSPADLQEAVCASFNRAAVGECAQYHWLCHDREAEEKSYVEGWLKYWEAKLKGYEPVSIKKCHAYTYETEGTVRMFYK